MHHRLRRIPRSGLLAALVITWACDGSTDPVPTLEGTWDLVGYVDHGVSAVATGTAEFATDGTFMMSGTVTFPGEPVDTVDVTGTWQQDGDRVTITTIDGSGVWQMTEQAATVTLTLVDVIPPARIILARPTPS